jgi:pyridoxamine 5'-phosphate oxidase
VLADRATLEERLAAVEDRYPDEVPRPPHWGGFRISPLEVEFWQGRPSRLHDRFRYRRAAPDDPAWVIERLAP